MCASCSYERKQPSARRTDAEHPVLSASVVLRVTKRRSHETGPAERCRTATCESPIGDRAFLWLGFA